MRNIANLVHMYICKNSQIVKHHMLLFVLERFNFSFTLILTESVWNGSEKMGGGGGGGYVSL